MRLHAQRLSDYSRRKRDSIHVEGRGLHTCRERSVLYLVLRTTSTMGLCRAAQSYLETRQHGKLIRWWNVCYQQYIYVCSMCCSEKLSMWSLFYIRKAIADDNG